MFGDVDGLPKVDKQLNLYSIQDVMKLVPVLFVYLSIGRHNERSNALSQMDISSSAHLVK